MKKILISLLAAVMILMSAVPVLADNYYTLWGRDTTTGHAVDLTDVRFNKYLLVTGVQTVPAANFDYEVSLPSGTYPNNIIEAATDKHPTIFKGNGTVKVMTETNTTAKDNRNTLEFTSSDALIPGPVDEETGQVIGNTDTGSWGSAADLKVEYDQSYVKKYVSLDFSTAGFREPGIYRYYLQEIPYTGNSPLIENDTQMEQEKDDTSKYETWRTIDIYVEDDLDVENQTQSNNIMGNGYTYDANKKLKVTGIVMYEGKLEDTVLPDQSSFTFDITKNEAGASTPITATTWTLSENNTTTTYTYDSSAGKWKYEKVVTSAGGSSNAPITGTVEMVPDAATSPDFSGKIFAEAYDEEYKAQAKAAKVDGENGVEAEEKNGTFVNEYETHEITVAKTVTGNQGSRDQYFKFTIDIANAGKNVDLFIDRTKHDIVTSTNYATSYTKTEMDAANSSGNKVGDTNVYKVTTDNDGTAQVVVYLQHGESIKITGLKKDATYTVTEDKAEKEGYKTSIEQDPIKKEESGTTWSGESTVFKGKVGSTFCKDVNGAYYYKASDDTFLSFDTKNLYKDNGAGADPRYVVDNDNGTLRKLSDGTYESAATVDASRYSKEVQVDFTNKRSGVIPTGLIMGISGGLAIVALAIVLMIFINRRHEDEDEA